MFITFEGIDGSGKSTQLSLLATTLQDQGYSVLTTRDPGGTSLGKQLREILLHHPGFIADPCELLLYLADRAQHVAEVIRPALDAGQIILCDRYLDSTLAYQGGGRGFNTAEIEQINVLATGGLMPDKTFLFDAPVDILLARAQKRSAADRLEQEQHAFYERVRATYLNLAKAEPTRITVMDATLDIDTLEAQMQQIVLSNLNPISV